MYMKNLQHKMTLRLTDELKTFIETMSDRYMISPSDYIRQILSQQMYAQSKAEELINTLPQSMKDTLTEAINKERQGFENGTDRKTNQHDIV